MLDARAAYPGNSLAALYDPLTMPANLRKAHDALDKAVDRCYRKEAFASDAERVRELFARYSDLTRNANCNKGCQCHENRLELKKNQ